MRILFVFCPSVQIQSKGSGFADFGKGTYPLFVWCSRLADRLMFWPVVSCVFVGVVFVFHTVDGRNPAPPGM